MSDRGFSDLAVESSQAFRSIMQAMARPGRIQPLGGNLSPPEPMLPATAAIALTLCDFQTPLWLSPRLRNARVMQYLRFHSGAPIGAEAEAAQFIFASTEDAVPAPSRLLHGSHEYPDRSATLVLQVQAFVPGAVELTGPGIRGSESFGAAGLGTDFWQAMAQNHARFPVGIDVIFAAPGMVAALPRSTAIRLTETV